MSESILIPFLALSLSITGLLVERRESFAINLRIRKNRTPNKTMILKLSTKNRYMSPNKLFGRNLKPGIIPYITSTIFTKR